MYPNGPYWALAAETKQVVDSPTTAPPPPRGSGTSSWRRLLDCSRLQSTLPQERDLCLGLMNLTTIVIYVKHLYTYMHIYIYMYICVHVPLHIVFTHISVPWVCIIYIYMYTHIHMCICIYTNILVYYIHKGFMFTPMCIYIYTYTHNMYIVHASGL